jgi:hypothetical protein
MDLHLPGKKHERTKQMRIYTIINLTKDKVPEKVKLFNNEEDAYNYFENYIKEVEPKIDIDEIEKYINTGNYKDKIFLIKKDLPTGYFQDMNDFLDFLKLMDNLGLDEQTAIRIFVKRCLATQSNPFEIKL